MKLTTVLIALGVSSGLLASITIWLFSEYQPTQAYQVAVEFVQLVKAKELQTAYELTAKNSLVGRDAQTFQTVVEHTCLEGRGRIGVFPSQTNGNRLRRWLSGRKVDIDEIGFEFEDPICPITLKLRRNANNDWKVYFFESHAQ